MISAITQHFAARFPVLIEALRDPACYPHPARPARVLETHISYVLLTGTFAYKIKKAVNLGFLDFTRLEQRHFFCNEEIRLNRRLVSGLYLGVESISGPPGMPRVGKDDAVIEYAVKMREFPQSALFDHLLPRGEIMPRQIDALADQLAAFHESLAHRPANKQHGSPDLVWEPVAQNFSQLHGHLAAGEDGRADTALLDALKIWCREEHQRLHQFLGHRQHGGFVRECHGDLHLGNVALIDDTPAIFDCVEFNPALRWIDVMNEVAFLSMDIEERGRPDYSHRFLNRYLELTGDYAGLRALPFYRVYRALVRAKVAHIRATQSDPFACPRQEATCSRYLSRAWQASLPGRPLLLIMNGVSGSGKSHLAQRLLERIGGIRLRSDVERKRLQGLPPRARCATAADSGLYDLRSTRATYQRLNRLARLVLEAGFPVLIDAANLKTWQRTLFRSLARRLNIPCLILACNAPDAILHRRLLQRAQAGNDASDAGLAVLRHQVQHSNPLSAEERAISLVIDTGYDTLDDVMQRIMQKCPS